MKTLQEDLDSLNWTGFTLKDCIKGENFILKPQLMALGWSSIRFWTKDGDSHGPLVRGVTSYKNDQWQEAYYGE